MSSTSDDGSAGSTDDGDGDDDDDDVPVAQTRTPKPMTSNKMVKARDRPDRGLRTGILSKVVEDLGELEQNSGSDTRDVSVSQVQKSSRTREMCPYSGVKVKPNPRDVHVSQV